ncbi:MAG: GH92 family glycosyl hydrolase [Bacteroidaceae bacterium]|nr:GH92 family glycosyl hydrolase [Bacteroidaceae bacterium]
MTLRNITTRSVILLTTLLLTGPTTLRGGKLTRWVNPLLGTATLWDENELGFKRSKGFRPWGGEVFPGAALPNAMVQLTPVTKYRSGAGYQYEDQSITGFAHTAKGHWNLLHVPLMPVTGDVDPDHFASPYSHDEEEAHPGYYSVELKRYGIRAELTTTLRCAYHRYHFRNTRKQSVVADMRRSNNHVSDWTLEQTGQKTFKGSQNGEGRIYFYAESNKKLAHIKEKKGERHTIHLITFEETEDREPLELKIGFSFVSTENAALNLKQEMEGKDFATVRQEADDTWEHLLENIGTEGGTDKQRGLMYSCLYRSFLWPCLRSDVNGEYRDARNQIVNNGFRYYTNPSFWDDYRNKLILLGLLQPEVATDVIKSITDRGEKSNGYMPTFFHGDHASTFVAGSWLRGIRGFDLQRAYRLLLKNATVPGRGGRPYLDEYLARGWIAEKDTTNVPTWDEYKAAVTKTVEYAYDDYATALVAKEVGDTKNYKLLKERSMNYRNLFDPETGFWRGKNDKGEWLSDFKPFYPYYAFQYREANAWQSLFYAPHDPEGCVSLYKNKKKDAERKLDSLFSIPWKGYEAYNFTGFMGNYCHGNQPGHSLPWMYYFVGKQEKSQVILDSLMNHYYDMGKEHLSYAGMDDAGEMSAWFAMTALGLYTFSPADPEYLVSVPLFPKMSLRLPNGKTARIIHSGTGRKIKDIRIDGKKMKGWFLRHDILEKGPTISIATP